ncbi:hypothetical protein EW145_g4429 [Phellinidium pouzarii]|uniref:Uncharacterized protein n=1 Tax=Phellinidium pouzarii TaxID=167371 RepID=A0A4S4L3P5_9AGAM|nr:hypothetical protein EW145_g4429 [Phellinidium pouzarii]
MATSESPQATFLQTMRDAIVALASLYKCRCSLHTYHPSKNSPHVTSLLARLNMVSTASSCIAHVLTNVKHLPRKASRLVCVADPGSSPKEKVAFMTADFGDAGAKAGANASTMRHSDSSGSSSAYYSGFSSSDPSSSSGHSERTATNPQSVTARLDPGPIITHEQLEAALSRTSLALEDIEDAPATPMSESMPISIPSIQLPSSQHFDSFGNLAFPSADSETPMLCPRPLSPPPEHFRRRVGSGAAASPFSTPAHSPSGSPRIMFALHDVLSSESLATHSLRLYEPGDDDNDDCSAVKDTGEYTRSLRIKKSTASGEDFKRVFSR